MDSAKHHVTPKEDKLPFIQKFGYGMGALVTIVSVNSLMNLSSLVYIDMLKMSPILFGIAAAIPRVWDFISDPIAGNISDNTRTRFGRRIPYVLFGGIFVGIAFAAVFWVPNAEDNLIHTKEITAPPSVSQMILKSAPAGKGILLADTTELHFYNREEPLSGIASSDSLSAPTLFRLKEQSQDYLAWFELAGKDGLFYKAQVVPVQSGFTLQAASVLKPLKAQLAWSVNAPDSNQRSERDMFLYFLLMSLIFYTAVTIYSVPHGALGFEMSSDYHERTRVFAYASFIGNVGAIASPWLYALARLDIFANEVQGIRFVCVVMGMILIASAIICAITAKERNFHKVEKQERVGLIESFKITLKNQTFVKLVISFVLVIVGFQFVMGFSNFIMIYYVYLGDKDAASVLMGWNGTIWAVTGLVGVLPMTWISTKIGKKNTVLFAFSLLVIGQMLKIVCYSQTYPWLTVIPTILLSWGMVMCFSLVNSMNADICDEDELNTGTRREGSYYAVYGWWWKAAVSIAYVISGYLLQFTGYNANLGQQSDATLFWLRFWEIGLPAILSILAILILKNYPLTEARVYEIKDMLKYKQESAGGALLPK